MKKFVVRCPGKIFLFGEYVCLTGRPALLATVGPEFELTVTPIASASAPEFFHLDSPAGIFFQRHRKDFEGLSFQWKDPFLDSTTGIARGLGSSTAQFLCLVRAREQVAGLKPLSLSDLLDLYREISLPQRPSGVDLIVQTRDAVSDVFSVRTLPTVEAVSLGSLKTFCEKSGADFMVVHTGTKVRTHDHLTTLYESGFPISWQVELTAIDQIVTQATHVWKANDARALGALMTAYQKILSEKLSLPARLTAHLEAIARTPGVLGCKNSGAQGGDSILVLVDRAFSQNLKEGLNLLHH